MMTPATQSHSGLMTSVTHSSHPTYWLGTRRTSMLWRLGGCCVTRPGSCNQLGLKQPTLCWILKPSNYYLGLWKVSPWYGRERVLWQWTFQYQYSIYSKFVTILEGLSILDMLWLELTGHNFISTLSLWMDFWWKATSKMIQLWLDICQCGFMPSLLMKIPGLCDRPGLSVRIPGLSVGIPAFL